MKSSTGKWLTLVGTLCVSATAASACSGDDSSSPGNGDGGLLDAALDQFVPDGATDTGAKDAGSDAKPDAGPGACGITPDPDPAVKVRFVNLLLPVNSGASLNQGTAFALRLNAGYSDSTVVSNFPVVPAGTGAASVTPYAKIPAGTITFSAQENSASPDGGAGFKVSATVQTVAAGARLTVVALGRPRVTGSATSRARLLILDESKLSSPTCSEIALRPLNADDALDSDAFTLGAATTPAETVSKLAAGAEAGVKAPLGTGVIALSATSLPAAFGPTGQAPFTIPSDVLAAGRSYFLASVGETYRFSDDERTHGLLLIPVGDDTPARFIKRDPLVFFFHASPPTTPSELEVRSGGARLAIGLKYGETPTYADLRPSGASLSFVQPASAPGGDGGAPVTILDNQSTGPLDPGGIYFTSLLGLANGSGSQQLRFKSWKLRPGPGYKPVAPDNPSLPLVTVFQASPTVAAADVGYWSLNPDGAKGNTFTSVFANIPYGESSAIRGAEYNPPWQSGSWYGAQAAGNASSNRAAFGTGLSSRWHAAVLMGDWNATDAQNGAKLVFVDLSQPATALTVPLTHP